MSFAIPATLLALLAVAVPTKTTAQSVPNLSGTWVLQVEKSDFGALPALTSRTDVFAHQEPQLTITRKIQSAGSETTSTLVYAVDGKPYKNMAGGSELTSTLKWEGQTLVMVTTVSNPQGEATITDRYTLAADGTTLTQVRMVVVQGQELKQTLLLARQP